MTLAHAPTQMDFTPEQWDALCWARFTHNMSAWYRLIRELCGYRSGSQIKTVLEALVDEWLRAHPTWRGAGMDANEWVRVLRDE